MPVQLGHLRPRPPAAGPRGSGGSSAAARGPAEPRLPRASPASALRSDGSGRVPVSLACSRADPVGSVTAQKGPRLCPGARRAASRTCRRVSLLDHLLSVTSLGFFFWGGVPCPPAGPLGQLPPTTPDPWPILSRTPRGPWPSRSGRLSASRRRRPPPNTWPEESPPLAQHQHGSRLALRRCPRRRQGVCVWGGRQPLRGGGAEAAPARPAAVNVGLSGCSKARLRGP